MKPISLAFAVMIVVGCVVMITARVGLARHQPEKTAMKTAVKPPAYSKSGYDIAPLTQSKVDELAKKLTQEERTVILAKGTEAAFCGNLLDNKKEGVYTCRLCGLPLFSSDAKFDSGTGWPSFFKPFDKDHVAVHEDRTHGMVREE